MKKITLTASTLVNKEILTRAQLKKILGGEGSEPGGPGGDSCQMTVTRYTTGAIEQIYFPTQNNPGDVEAVAWCREFVQTNPGSFCRYHCESGGFGS
jgi:hypothetical protein